MNRECYNEKEKELLEMYDEMFIEDCDVCRRCREITDSNNGSNQKLSRPVSVWFVGNKFHTHNIRILFVGKNARGFFSDSGDKNERGVDRGFNNAFSSRYNLSKKGWAYWNYFRSISRQIYRDDDVENIAITNMVKCNNSASVDTTSDYMKKCCIKELRIIHKEIEIIKPTHIVFATGKDYDGYIEFVFDSIEKVICDGTKQIGKYTSPWKEGVGKIDNDTIRFLRTCHPERKKKEDYVTAVVSWVNRQ